MINNPKNLNSLIQNKNEISKILSALYKKISKILEKEYSSYIEAIKRLKKEDNNMIENIRYILRDNSPQESNERIKQIQESLDDIKNRRDGLSEIQKAIINSHREILNEIMELQIEFIKKVNPQR